MKRPHGPALLAGAFVAGVLTTSAGYLTYDGGTHAYFSDAVTVTLHVGTEPSPGGTHPTGRDASHETGAHAATTPPKPSKSPATEQESTRRTSTPPPPTASGDTSPPESTGRAGSESTTPPQRTPASTSSSTP